MSQPVPATSPAAACLSAPGAPRDRRLAWLLAGLLALLTVLAFAAVRHGEFVDYDDPDYVYENPVVQQGLTWAGVQWAMTTGATGYWHPLTWLTLMLDRSLYGPGAAGFHVTNLLLHTLAALTLFGLLRTLTGATWRSALVAAVFAIHPLRVESVAWVAERKDVLCGLLMLLTVWAYAWYCRRPGAGRYVVLAVIYALALMAKPMAVTVPALLLLLDYWPLGRLTLSGRSLGWRVVEKAPLLLLGFLDALAAMRVQWTYGAMAPLTQMSFAPRVENALVSYVRYLGKLLWPTDLAVLYPLPASGWALWQAGGALALLLVITALALWQWRCRPWLLVGWLWYGGMALPVIGLIQVGQQAMADRYSYLPTVGVLVALAWSLPARWGQGAARWLSAGVVAGLLLTLLLLTQRQVRVWHTSETLYTHTLAVTGENPTAETGLAAVLVSLGRLDEGAAHCQLALRSNPGSVRANATLAIIYFRQGHFDEAQRAAANAVALGPDNVTARLSLAAALAAQGERDAAIVQYQEALRLDPLRVGAQVDLAKLLLAAGKLDEADAALDAAQRLSPHSAQALNTRGLLRNRQGRRAEALDCFAQAVAANPQLSNAQVNYGVALLQAGRAPEALAPLQAAVAAMPASGSAQIALAAAYDATGDPKQAVAHARAALALDPASVPAQALLARLAAAVPASTSP